MSENQEACRNCRKPYLGYHSFAGYGIKNDTLCMRVDCSDAPVDDPILAKLIENRARLESLEATVRKQVTELANCRMQVADAQTELKRARGVAQAAEQQTSAAVKKSLDAAAETHRDEIGRMRQEAEELGSQLKQEKKALADLEERLTTALSAKADLQRVLSTVRKAIETGLGPAQEAPAAVTHTAARSTPPPVPAAKKRPKAEIVEDGKPAEHAWLPVGTPIGRSEENAIPESLDGLDDPDEGGGGDPDDRDEDGDEEEDYDQLCSFQCKAGGKPATFFLNFVKENGKDGCYAICKKDREHLLLLSTAVAKASGDEQMSFDELTAQLQPM